MEQREILKYWYADIYEQQETSVEDVAYLLSLVGAEPKRILEVACGGGRICVPLAQAGHAVMGFDMDGAMLERAKRKAGSTENLTLYQADALKEGWGKDFDVVVLAGNLLVNIETDGDYQQAQRLFIRKAADCLATGGRMFLDFDVPDWPDQSEDDRREWVCFEGIDDRGTYGKFVVVSGDYSRRTRVDRSFRRYEITPAEGQPFVVERQVTKHFPTLEQVIDWCHGEGFEVEPLFQDCLKNPAGTNASHAVVWAKKI